MDETPMPEEIRNRRILLAIAGGFFAIVIIGIVLSRGDDTPPRAEPPTDSLFGPPSTGSPAPIAEQPDSEVAPIDCNDMLTFAEVDEALGSADNPALGNASALSLNEECTFTMDGDESYFVQLSPSGPADFAPGTELLGVTAEPVAGVGLRAVWFGGDDAESGGDSGVIAVEETTEYGRLFVRMFVGRPDVDEATQQEIAVGLAESAIARFPGVAVEPPPEPVAYEFPEVDEEPPDRAGEDLAENLLAREADGDWTRAEGIIATLGYMAGEVPATEVLSTDDLTDPSGTPVILLAEEYLAGVSTDDADAVEIQRLLDRLGSARPDASPNGRIRGDVLPNWAVALVQEDPATPSDPCADVPLTESCASPVVVQPRPGVPDGKYRLFADLREGSNWTQAYVTAAIDGMLDAAAVYEPLGAIPPTDVVLHQGGEIRYTLTRATECEVYLNDEVVGARDPDDQFKQLIAREMAFCLLRGMFNEQMVADYNGTGWWIRGFANYLSGVVYPNANSEHATLPAQLAAEELSTTIVDRSWTNWALFEYLHGEIGVEGNLANISGFPVGGDHAAALAAYSDMAEQFHAFELALTDANLNDLGNGTVPYEPRDWDFDIVVPVTAELAVPRFGVRRIAITVAEEKLACLTVSVEGSPDVSWRPGVVGEAGSWEDFPEDGISGEWVLVVSTVEELSRVEVIVDRVIEESSCRDEPPPPSTLGDFECVFDCGPSRYYYQ